MTPPGLVRSGGWRYEPPSSRRRSGQPRSCAWCRRRTRRERESRRDGPGLVQRTRSTSSCSSTVFPPSPSSSTRSHALAGRHVDRALLDLSWVVAPSRADAGDDWSRSRSRRVMCLTRSGVRRQPLRRGEGGAGGPRTGIRSRDPRSTLRARSPVLRGCGFLGLLRYYAHPARHRTRPHRPPSPDAKNPANPCWTARHRPCRRGFESRPLRKDSQRFWC